MACCLNAHSDRTDFLSIYLDSQSNWLYSLGWDFTMELGSHCLSFFPSSPLVVTERCCCLWLLLHFVTFWHMKNDTNSCAFIVLNQQGTISQWLRSQQHLTNAPNGAVRQTKQPFQESSGFNSSLQAHQVKVLFPFLLLFIMFLNVLKNENFLRMNGISCCCSAVWMNVFMCNSKGEIETLLVDVTEWKLKSCFGTCSPSPNMLYYAYSLFHSPLLSFSHIHTHKHTHLGTGPVLLLRDVASHSTQDLCVCVCVCCKGITTSLNPSTKSQLWKLL